MARGTLDEDTMSRRLWYCRARIHVVWTTALTGELSMRFDTAATHHRSGSALWLYAALAFIVILALGPNRSLADEPPVDLNRLEQAFQRVTDQVSPSVVGIRARRRHFTQIPSPDTAADQTFEQLVIVNGSGTVVDADGLILTNEHVVRGAEDLTIVLHDGSKLAGTVFAADARSDLAIVHVNRKSLPPAKFCQWSAVKRGQWSIAIGNPFGLGSDGQLSVSVGVISNLDRQLPGLGQVDDRSYSDMIQTTATINPGNSGGPLFNIRGELIGIVTAMHTRAGGDEGAGFAIPMTPARVQIISRLRRGESPKHGYFGLNVRPRSNAATGAAVKGQGAGITIESVDAGGPASQSGLDAGDLITLFDDYPINNPGDLVATVAASAGGHPVSISVSRAGRPLDLKITPTSRAINTVAWLRDRSIQWRGLRLTSRPIASALSPGNAPVPAGLRVIDVSPGSSASRAPIEIGDTVTQVDGEGVLTIDDFRRRIAARAGNVRLRTAEHGEVVVRP
jgi:serine protease Do